MTEEKIENSRDLQEFLKEGWAISGYSVCMMSGGLLAHNILLQKSDNVQSLTIVSDRDKEVGRTIRVFSPKPEEPKKKGFWG